MIPGKSCSYFKRVSSARKMADMTTLRSLFGIYTINTGRRSNPFFISIIGVEIRLNCERETKYKSVHEYSRKTGKNSELVYRTRKNHSSNSL